MVGQRSDRGPTADRQRSRDRGPTVRQSDSSDRAPTVRHRTRMSTVLNAPTAPTDVRQRSDKAPTTVLRQTSDRPVSSDRLRQTTSVCRSSRYYLRLANCDSTVDIYYLRSGKDYQWRSF